MLRTFSEIGNERRKRKEVNNVVELQVSGEKILLKIPRTEIVQEFDNIAAFDLKTKKVISIGVGREEFQNNFPRQWKKYKGRLEFAPIFDVQAFRPEAAGLFLWRWLNAMIIQIAGNSIFRVQAKLELNIVFEIYENIPLEKQREFEYFIYAYLFAKKITINGKEKTWDRKNRLPLAALTFFDFAFSLIPIILSLPFAFILLGRILTGIVSSSLYFIFLTMGFLGVLSILVYLCLSLSTALWALAFKPFIPSENLALALKYQYAAQGQQNSYKLTRLLAYWIITGKAQSD